MIDNVLLGPLLEKLRADQGDQASRAQLTALLRPQVTQSVRYRAGVHLCLSEHDDIAQEVFVNILKKQLWKKTACPVRFLGLLACVLKRRVADWLRSSRIKRGKLDLEGSQAKQKWKALFTATPSESEVHQRTEEELEYVQASIARDELDRRIVAELAQGKKQKEIADELGVNAATVSRRLDQMRQARLALSAVESGRAGSR
jgi:RNA polymerase sigma factor (sigma-70 family)